MSRGQPPRHELDRRRREELRRSLAEPHPETAGLADVGLAEWASGLPVDEAGSLLDMSRGRPVRWSPGEGWIELKE